MKSDIRYLELKSIVDNGLPQQGSSATTFVLLIVMLLVAAVLIILPPAISVSGGPRPSATLTLDMEIVESDGHHDHHLYNDSKLYPVVTLKHYGDLRGVYENGVRAFHGVPFAEPPLGNLRWRPPQAMKPWHPAILDASKRKAACLQNPTLWSPEKWISEDCLYLEIYAPIDLVASRARLPIMFYIHGGAYRSFSATDQLFDGSTFVRRTGAIVVVVEYRLGIMGFLVHGNRENIKGNFGLLDQAFALQWVHYNIAAFGGDPRKITLVGQSAGAQSSIVHLMSKKTSKLFRSIILESPPVPLPVKTYSEGFAQTILVSRHVNCPGDMNDDFGMECLRNTDAQTMLNAQKMSKSFGEMYLDRPEPWGPVIDEKLVHGPLLKGFTSGKHVPRKPMMWGVMSEEALLFIRMLRAKPSGFLLYAYSKMVFHRLGMDSSRLAALYPLQYEDTRTIISNMFTDFLFRCPTEWAVEQIKDHWPWVWTYVFEKSVPISPDSPFSICSMHACHGMNIPYIFNSFDYFNVSATNTDAKISEDIIYYYGNFLWYGNPNGKEVGEAVTEERSDNKLLSHMPHWPRSYEDKNNYQNMVFQTDGSLDIGSGVRSDKCEFWYKKFP